MFLEITYFEKVIVHWRKVMIRGVFHSYFPFLLFSKANFIQFNFKSIFQVIWITCYIFNSSKIGFHSPFNVQQLFYHEYVHKLPFKILIYEHWNSNLNYSIWTKKFDNNVSYIQQMFYGFSLDNFVFVVWQPQPPTPCDPACLTLSFTVGTQWRRLNIT